MRHYCADIGDILLIIVDFQRPLTTVTPTLDGDVLTVLARAEAEFTGRAVHRLLGRASERGVRNALERLVRQGVVISRRAGASKLYRLNADHLAAPAVKALATLREELLRRLARTVAEWDAPPAQAVLFGSVARGDADEGSDLDILVVRPHDVADYDRWQDQLTRLQRDATAWTGNDCRVLEYREDELNRQPARDRVLTAALREGVPLLARGDDGGA